MITALLMIAVSLVTYYNLPAGSSLHYSVYAVYAIGIVWTLVAYRNSPAFTGKFGESFGVGFRCFIVATLVMVVYTFVFNKLHPEFAEEAARLYKEQQLAIKNNSKTPDEIVADAARYKNGYAMAVVYGSIFGYLIIGAAVTAAVSGLLTSRNK
jgi:Protein of unknown function (DUF4199)